MSSFGRKSESVKATINPLLAMLCDNVVKYFDISLINGLRRRPEQNRLYDVGLSQKQWPYSNHNVKDEDAPFPDNLSMAVDATPYPIPEGWGDLRSQNAFARDLEWKERVKFYQMMAVFKFEWARLKEKYANLKDYELRFGADWDGDNDFRDQTFDDLPHIELKKIANTLSDN